MARDLSALGLTSVESDEGASTVELLLGDDAPDLAVVDWDLPGCNGPELCRQVRAQRHSSPPYIIVLAQTDEQIGEAFAAGADHCLNAAAGEHELQARIFAARRLGALRVSDRRRTLRPHSDRRLPAGRLSTRRFGLSRSRRASAPRRLTLLARPFSCCRLPRAALHLALDQDPVRL